MKFKHNVKCSYSATKELIGDIDIKIVVNQKLVVTEAEKRWTFVLVKNVKTLIRETVNVVDIIAEGGGIENKTTVLF